MSQPTISPRVKVDAPAFEAALATAPNATEFSMALLRPEEGRILRRCAVPRRFDSRLLREVLRDDAAVGSDIVSDDEVIHLPGVLPDRSREGWYRVSGQDRADHEDAWLNSDGLLGSAEDLGRKRFAALNGRLAVWFGQLGPDGEVDAVYHALVSDPAAAAAKFLSLYQASYETFDLARCESLLDVLDERARVLDTSLASFRTEARALLRARGAFVHDYRGTARFLAREALTNAFESLLPNSERFILLLHGPGGRGKTMFLRWLAARYCAPREIPSARVDFDFLGQSDSGLEPRFFFGRLAEQLNLQLRGSPFNEMLAVVSEMRRDETVRRAAVAPTQAPLRDQDEDEIVTRLATILEESCRGPVVLVFDTLEDARIRHQIDLLALVRAIDGVRRRVAALAVSHGRLPPRVLLLLSGRYTLAHQYPDVEAEFGEQVLAREVPPFDEAESCRYLLEVWGVPDSPAMRVVVKVAGGSPIRLALYAEMLVANPQIAPEAIALAGNVDTYYLVERVLSRLADPKLRWVLRYGVVAPRLTRDFIETVLAGHLEQALQGSRELDDPDADAVRDERWKPLWRTEPRARAAWPPVDYAKLWDNLRAYQGPGSWISASAEAGDALVFHPAVARPMRRVLRAHPVYRAVQKDAVRVYQERVRAGKGNVAENLAALTYFDFQLRGPRAAAAWRKRLKEHGHDERARRALASAVLSEDLQSADDAGAVHEPAAARLVPPEVETQAHFELARAAGDAAGAAVGEQHQRLLDEARAHLVAFDQARTAAPRFLVPSVREAMLRWRLALNEEAQRAVLAQLLAADTGRMSAKDRGELLLTLGKALSARDPLRAEEYGRRYAAVVRGSGDGQEYTEAVLSVVQRRSERGEVAGALRECAKAIAALSDRQWKWSGERRIGAAQSLLIGKLATLEARCGLVSSALRRFARPAARRTGSTAAEHLDRFVQRAGLLLCDRDPLEARRAAREGKKLLNARKDLRHADAVALGSAWDLQQVQRSQIFCQLREARALLELMDFAPALDLMESCRVQVGELGDLDVEAAVRLEKASVHLHHVRNLIQAADVLDDRDGAMSERSIEVQVGHTVLRAALHDALGDDAQASRLAAAALDLAEKVVRERARIAVKVTLSTLALDRSATRVATLEKLEQGLRAFDHPSARLSLLRALRFCAPVADVPRGLADSLVELTARPPSGATDSDLVRLALIRVELLRVVGRADGARRTLLGLRRSVLRMRRPVREREIALACDRVGLKPEDVLSEDWSARFQEELEGEPRLRAAELIERAERRFRSDSVVAARTLGKESKTLLRLAVPVTSNLDVRVTDLLAACERENGLDARARSLDAEVLRLHAELGHPGRQHERPLSVLRSMGWKEVLERAERVSVRFDMKARPTLTAWGRGALRSHQLRETPLANLMRAMQPAALGGPAQLQIVARLTQPGTSFHRAAAASLFSPAIGPRLADRLSRPGPPLDLEIAADHSSAHALPWELSMPEGATRPIAREPGLRYLWRSTPTSLDVTRVTWAQRALTRFLGRSIVADGALGPLTQRAVADAQQLLSLATTGELDADTRRALRRTLRAPQVDGPRTVLIVQPEHRIQVATTRGASGHGVRRGSALRAVPLPRRAADGARPHDAAVDARAVSTPGRALRGPHRGIEKRRRAVPPGRHEARLPERNGVRRECARKRVRGPRGRATLGDGHRRCAAPSQPQRGGPAADPAQRLCRAALYLECIAGRPCHGPRQAGGAGVAVGNAGGGASALRPAGRCRAVPPRRERWSVGGGTYRRAPRDGAHHSLCPRPRARRPGLPRARSRRLSRAWKLSHAARSRSAPRWQASGPRWKHGSPCQSCPALGGTRLRSRTSAAASRRCPRSSRPNWRPRSGPMGFPSRIWSAWSERSSRRCTSGSATGASSPSGWSTRRTNRCRCSTNSPGWRTGRRGTAPL